MTFAQSPILGILDSVDWCASSQTRSFYSRAHVPHALIEQCWTTREGTGKLQQNNACRSARDLRSKLHERGTSAQARMEPSRLNERPSRCELATARSAGGVGAGIGRRRSVRCWAPAVSKIRSASRIPSARGCANRSAASASRAALAASAGSDLPPGRLLARCSRPASVTCWPLSVQAPGQTRPCDRVPFTAHTAAGPVHARGPRPAAPGSPASQPGR